MLNDIPYTDELDPYVNGKRSLERHTRLETLFVILRVHGVRERQLFEVARREKTDFLDHASEDSCCTSAAREPKNTNVIPRAI